MAERMTQAQALLAVLAGGLTKRRVRLYYRNQVLKSTLYSPIAASKDSFISSCALSIYATYINPINIENNDSINISASMFIERLVTNKPEASDFIANSGELYVTAFYTKTVGDGLINKPSNGVLVDEVSSGASLSVSRYDAIYPEPLDDMVYSTASLVIMVE